MNTAQLTDTLRTLFGELIDGAPATGAFILNPGDQGLLDSLANLSAEAASALTASGASVAAHVEHVRYGLALMNRWAAGENPFHDADWAASWKRTSVSAAEWLELRQQLAAQAAQWAVALRTPRDVNAIELNGMIGSVAHLAYHLGAIRQIDPLLRGPSADD